MLCKTNVIMGSRPIIARSQAQAELIFCVCRSFYDALPVLRLVRLCNDDSIIIYLQYSGYLASAAESLEIHREGLSSNFRFKQRLLVEYGEFSQVGLFP
jgi:hypothetical protein